MIRSLLLVTAIAAAASPACVLAQDPAAGDAYLASAAAAGLFEVESSRLALERSRNANIRGYARMMINHNEAASLRLGIAARKAGLNPAAPALDAGQRQRLAALRNESDQAFNQAYMSLQLAAHGETLGVHRRYLEGGPTDYLARAASAIVPVIEGNLQHARTLSNTAGSGRRQA